MHTSIIPHGGLSKRKTTTIVDRTTSSIITNTSKYGSNDLSSPKSFGSRCGDHPKDLDKGGRKVLNSLQLFKTDVIRILKSKKIVLVAGLYCTILLTAKYVEDVKLGGRIHPKVVGCYFAPEGNAMLKIRRLPVYDEDRYPSKRTVVWSDQDEEAENKLRNSRKYNRARAEMRDDDECSLPYDWQKKSYPTCNNIHENDMTQFFNEGEHKVEERLLLLDHGFFRDIWTFKPHDGGTTMVLKTLREIHELTDRNFDRHRRDALVMEHLTSSNHSAQIYSFCGNSIHSEFATMGTVSDLIWPLSGENSTMTSFDRLQLALKVAQAVNDVHMYDEQGLATVAHTDITPSQFLVFEDGSIKINDFNRCRFLLRNDRGEICPYKVSHNPGKFRSPEEYGYTDQTEKVDIFSMGNVIYSIITGLWPFEAHADVKQVQKNIILGIRPPIENISNDPILSSLAEVIHLCWKQNSNERPTATQIALLLEAKVEDFESSSGNK